MRLIDADARIDDLQNELKAGYMGCEKADYFEKLIQDYKDQPAIDAEPIIHGHWVKTIYGDFMCSCCYIANCAEGNFCSWCGAKMDETIEVINNETVSDDEY